MYENLTLGASVSCFDLIDIKSQLAQVEKARVDFLHYDVVDGRFNRCFILGLPLLKAIRAHTRLPIEVHLAVHEPELFIEQFANEGADLISIHPEGTGDLLKAFDLIRRCKAVPALALRSETGPSEVILEAAGQAAYIIKLTVNPGFSGQTMQEAALGRMAALREALDARGIRTRIAADGNVNAATIPTMVAHGADMLIGGTSGLFRPGKTVAEQAEEMLGQLEAAKKR